MGVFQRYCHGFKGDCETFPSCIDLFKFHEILSLATSSCIYAIRRRRQREVDGLPRVWSADHFRRTAAISRDAVQTPKAPVRQHRHRSAFAGIRIKPCHRPLIAALAESKLIAN